MQQSPKLIYWHKPGKGRQTLHHSGVLSKQDNKNKQTGPLEKKLTFHFVMNHQQWDEGQNVADRPNEDEGEIDHKKTEYDKQSKWTYRTLNPEISKRNTLLICFFVKYKPSCQDGGVKSKKINTEQISCEQNQDNHVNANLLNRMGEGIHKQVVCLLQKA